MPKALPSAKPRPDSGPIRCGGARFGSMALQKMPEYSNEQLARISAAMTKPRPAVMPGTANQLASMQGAPNSTQNRIHGLRRPPASAMAPRIGAPMAMMIAAIEVM